MIKAFLLSIALFVLTGCYTEQDIYSMACNNLNSISKNMENHKKVRDSCISTISKISDEREVTNRIKQCVEFAEKSFPVDKKSYLIGKSFKYSPRSAYSDASKNGCGA